MNDIDLKAELLKLKEVRWLTKLSAATGINRRTFQRIIKDQKTVHPATLKVLTAELRKAKWAISGGSKPPVSTDIS